MRRARASRRRRPGRLESAALSEAMRYARTGSSKGLLRRLARRFGLMGQLVADMLDILTNGSPDDVTPTDIGEAIDLLERSGYDVTSPGSITAPPVAGAVPSRPGPRPPTPPPPGRSGHAGGKSPYSGHTGGESPYGDPEDDWPAEHLVDTRLRLRGGEHPNADSHDYLPEVQTPSSSNVYAFTYDKYAGILYVYFKAPGKADKDGHRPHIRGPLYSYGGAAKKVPESLYHEFKAASSRGEFVWDRLRIRGTIHGHQYVYTLVAASMAGGRTYVPRKATAKGFRTRTIPMTNRVNGVKRITLMRSTLPPTI